MKPPSADIGPTNGRFPRVHGWRSVPVPFGRHQDESLGSIPRGYVIWLYDTLLREGALPADDDFGWAVREAAAFYSTVPE